MEKKLARMLMEEKRGNELRYLNEFLMQDFLNSSQGKQCLDKHDNIIHMEMTMKNTGVSMPETACMFYPHHRSLKINVMSQLL